MAFLVRLKRLFWICFSAIIITLFIVSGSIIGFFLQVRKQLPDLSILKDYEPSLITKIYSADGQTIAQFCLEKRILVPYNSLPKHLIQAIIAIEDAHFYRHKGIDWEGITRAAFRNIKLGYFAEGGSTITQQLTRSLFLHSDKTIMRKFKEVLLALKLEELYPKEKIIEMYLNQIYLGNGAYGVESSSLTYFGKSVEDLTIPEAALLAGLPRAPNKYNPFRYPERAVIRRNLVLKRMLDEGFIDYNQYQNAISSDLVLVKSKSKEDIAPFFVEYIRQYLEEQYGASALYRGGLKVYTTLNIKMQQYAETALKKGLEELDKRQGFRKPGKQIGEMDEIKGNIQSLFPTDIASGQMPQGLLRGRVESVSEIDACIKIIDTDFWGILKLEDASWTKVKSMKSILDTNDIIHVRALEIIPDKGGSSNLTGESDVQLMIDPNSGLGKDREEGCPSPSFQLALEQIPEVQGALIAIEPGTGQIKAMVGGYDFKKSKFNRAVQARRQPGSAFKPFIYTTALKQKYTLADIFIDSPIIYEDEKNEKDWKPVNYYQRFYGPTTLREALEKSRNIITIKILKEVGIEASIETARKMGIESPLAPDLSLALGSSGISLLELTSAYGVLANGGIRAKPLAITRIEGPDGRVLEENSPILDRALDQQTAYLMVQALRGVVDHGTGWRAKALGRPVAGKTGTTNNYIDAWFIGFTPDLLAGVWVGLDEYKSLGEMETGSKAASPIWVNFMKACIKNTPVNNFPFPPEITFTAIDPKSGLTASDECPNILIEVFKAGTEPKKRCNAHQMHKENFAHIDMDLSNKGATITNNRREIMVNNILSQSSD